MIIGRIDCASVDWRAVELARNIPGNVEDGTGLRLDGRRPILGLRCGVEHVGVRLRKGVRNEVGIWRGSSIGIDPRVGHRTRFDDDRLVGRIGSCAGRDGPDHPHREHDPKSILSRAHKPVLVIGIFGPRPERLPDCH
jgi:hypothetical protein